MTENIENENERLSAGIWLSLLTRIASLHSNVITRILQHAGSIENVFNLNTKNIIELIEGPPEKVTKANVFLKDATNRINAINDGKKHYKNGIRILGILDEYYPERLKTISSPPALLYYSGQESIKILQQNYYVSIVGTRNPTPYGEAATRKIVADLSQKGVVVISGMARGIDSIAHETTIENNGMTIAVLGCGLDIVYPPENKGLMNRINNKGMLISECPPGTKPVRSYFPARNRIISGLSDCVAIIEASKKSGTMITAGYAGDQGRDLFAVPGSIFSPGSQGTNQLIQDGACVLTNVDDMLWKLPFQNVQNMFSINSICNSMEEENAMAAVTGNYIGINYLNDNKTTTTNTSNNNNNINNNNRDIFTCNDNNKSSDSKTNKEKVNKSHVNSSTTASLTNYSDLKNILLYTEKTIDEIAMLMGITIEKASEILSFSELTGEVLCRNGRFSLTESYK